MKTFFKVMGIILLVLFVIGIAISIFALLKPLLIICAIVATIYFAYRYYKASEDDLTIDDKKLINAEKENYPNLKDDIIKQNKNKYIKNAVISAVATLAIALFIPSTAAIKEQQQKTEAENQKKQEEIELAREESEKEREKEKEEKIAAEEAEEKEEEEKSKRREDIQSLQVLDTIDGDTLEVLYQAKNTKLRLIGVDTPETVHPSKPVEFMGKEASDFTKNQLLDETIWVEKDVSETDQYNRILRYVWLEDPSDLSEPTYEDIRDKTFNGVLIREGYAKASTYPPDVKYQEFFSKIEQEARDAKKGLWNEEALAEFENGNPEQVATAPDQEQTQNSNQGKIKGNRNSMIYHVPGGASYDKVSEANAVYFNTEEEAQAAGYRRAKR